MKFEEALRAEIGDVSVCGINTVNYKVGDEVILVERARDFNELANDTGGYFYHRRTKQCFGANIQDFNYKEQYCWSEVGCSICTHKWVAVRPILVDRLECPHCGKYTSA